MNQQNHSAHWIDKLADGILKWQKKSNIKQLHVDDMKTPSGRVHTGALKGVLLHDMVAKALAEKTTDVVSTYVFNDMDPMDGLPNYLSKAEYEQHMGKPMYKIPAPSLKNCGIDLTAASSEELADFKNAKNFGEFYAMDFIHAFRKLGCQQKIVWSHELYESGQMDEVIREALDNVEKFRKIYKEVAEYDLPTNWHPFQVICPQCGKVGTTLVTGWDGQEVTYECQENKVEWAKGCNHSGKISPFGGTGKLLWKVDWPAHWKVMGVNIEGAGKDHTSAGGSRDMANVICEEVFHIHRPFDIPYEWILIRGAKMSSSKGVGTSAREFTNLFPAEIGRFLFANKHYGQVIDFDPSTMAIPDLFDEYDQAAKIYWGSEEGDQRLGRAFEISQVDEIPTKHFLPRFRDVALWMQDPAANLTNKFAEIKGSELNKQELDLLNLRKIYAQKWVESYAPEEFQLTAKKQLPEQAKNLNSEQKKFLISLIDLINSQNNWNPDDLQQKIYELAKSSLGAKAGFQAIYLAFLGKSSGPKAAWFLLNIDKELREKRVREVTESVSTSTDKTPNSKQSKYVSDEVRQKFPGIFFAQVMIKNVQINKKDEKLEQLKQQVLKKRQDLSTDAISQMLPIQEYKKLFKATGTDWHSKRPSPDALLRRIALGKGLYNVNTAVDAYNLAVIETSVGLGGFDADELKLPIVLRFSKEGEEMLLLGDKEKTKTRAGQLIYADQVKPVTIDLNYRDINETKLTEKTKNIMLYADGAPGLDQELVVDALRKGAEYIQQFCGGEVGEIEVKE